MSPVLLLISIAAATPNPPKPHIVYVLSDNLGHGNVGYLRARSPAGPSPEVVTPRIDELVRTGVELSRLYTYKFCSPSRCSLLTGRLPVHVNTHNDPYTVPGAGIPLGMTTIAAKLQSAGYHTHQVGKWHAGLARTANLPVSRGFNSSFGYLQAYNDYLHGWSGTPCPQFPGNVSYNGTAETGVCTATSVRLRHLSYTTDLWDSHGPAYGLNGTGFMEAMLAERAIGIIEGHDVANPLFLYYAMHLLHSPLCAPPGWTEKFGFIQDSEDRRYVAAATNYLDSTVGAVVDALMRTGLWGNCLFIWSSDNGAAIEIGTGAKNSYPLRGGYYTNWEGGIRAPGLVNGGLLPDVTRGTVRDGAGSFIHLADMWATFCGLAGVDPADPAAAVASLPPPDSLDMWPMLSGANLTSPRTEWLLTAIGDPVTIRPTGGIVGGDTAYISGKYKLLLNGVAQASWEGPEYPNGSSIWNTWATVENCTTPTKRGCLFNIIDDPTEHTDLHDALPEVVDELLRKINESQKTFFDPDRGQSDDAGACAQVVRRGGFWGPWLPP